MSTTTLLTIEQANLALLDCLWPEWRTEYPEESAPRLYIPDELLAAVARVGLNTVCRAPSSRVLETFLVYLGWRRDPRAGETMKRDAAEPDWYGPWWQSPSHPRSDNGCGTGYDIAITCPDEVARFPHGRHYIVGWHIGKFANQGLPWTVPGALATLLLLVLSIGLIPAQKEDFRH